MASARAVLLVLRNFADDERVRKAAAVDATLLPPRDVKREPLPLRADADARIDARDRSEGLMRPLTNRFTAVSSFASLAFVTF